MSGNWNRRSVLRGMMGGASVAVALPFLDCFLNDNGTALAGTGVPLPVRFGTWFWGCGMNAKVWVPTKTGIDYDLLPELMPIAPIRDHVSILSGFKVTLDGRGNISHFSGPVGIRAGIAPTSSGKVDAPTFDVLISDVIGRNTRFRSLEVACTGGPLVSLSYSAGNVLNPAEPSPLALYTRVFGSDFVDPNASEFTPDPAVMLRRSVLSGVSEERLKFVNKLGAADRLRLDEFFTSLRQLENQLELQLHKPPPTEACVVGKTPAEKPIGSEIGEAIDTHAQMAQLLAMAMACNQTRTINVAFSEPLSTLRKRGSSATHHTLTHEEPIDERLGYQPDSSWFTLKTMEAWSTFVQTLASVKEGDGTLLDNCLIVAHSDTSLAKVHSIDGIPVMIAGRAGSKVRAGIHIDGNGAPITRVGLTAQQIMGVTIDRWGADSMQVDKPISELLV